MDPTIVFLVRHGETEANREDRLRGRFDVPLNDEGRRQARRAGAALAAHPVAAIYSSPLSRARETAALIGAELGLEAAVHPGLDDMNFGAWQGRLRSEIKQEWAELYDLYDRHPERFRAPDGDSLADLQARALAGLDDIVARHRGGCVVAVSHMVTLHVLILGLLGMGVEKYWNLRLATGSISRVEYGPNGYVLASLNTLG